MVYISDGKETVRILMGNDCYDGSLENYLQQFNKLNNNACPTADTPLQPYCAYMLPSDPPIDWEGARELIPEIQKFSDSERKKLRELQDAEYDFPTQLAMADLMKELQAYAKTFRKFVDDPLVTTPWEGFNDVFTNRMGLDLFGEGATIGRDLLKNSRRYIGLEDLYGHMMNRDVLNRQLHQIRSTLHHTNLKYSTLVRGLELQLKEENRLIKVLLPKKLDSLMQKYLRKGLSPEEMRKIRITSYSKKMASKGKMATTTLGFLKKSGLKWLRSLIEGLDKFAGKIENGGFYIDTAVVAYDTQKAYREGGDPMRAFLGSTASLAAGGALLAYAGSNTAVGAYTIGALGGTLAGEAALSGTLLVCCPMLGWIAVAVVGLAVVGYVGYLAKNAVEDLWDAYGDNVCNAVSGFVDGVRKDVMTAWNSASSWVYSWYGSD